MKNRKLWIVRIAPLKDYSYTKEYIEKGKIMIGWKGLLTIEDFDEEEQILKKIIRNKIKTHYPKEIKSIKNYIGSICNFQKIKNRDLVIVPQKGSKEFWIGKVTNDSIKQENDKNAGYSKEVEYYNNATVYTKDMVTPDFLGTMKSNGTVLNADKHLKQIVSLTNKNATNLPTKGENKIIYFRIGFCDAYNGNKDDKPTGNMQGLKDGFSHEIMNFYNNNGTVYGYAPMEGKNRQKSLNIRKNFNLKTNQESTNNVTVVWFTCRNSQSNKSGVIVGWYENATVFKNRQIENGNKVEGQHIDYFAKTSYDNCYLIEKDNRPKIKDMAPRESLAKQSIVYYGNEELNKQVFEWIHNKKKPRFVIV